MLWQVSFNPHMDEGIFSAKKKQTISFSQVEGFVVQILNMQF